MKDKLIALAGFMVIMTACVHETNNAELSKAVVTQAPFHSDLGLWVEYVNSLDGMSPKDLKGEVDRLRRVNERNWDDELRLGLANSITAQKARNYQKAQDILVQLQGKIQANTDIRSWLKLSIQQLAAAVQLDKDLTEEKRLRADLEKKLKALSDIERDISERGKNSASPHP